MITTYNNTLYGLSTDDKPNNANNGIIFHEIDTSKEYMFDAQGKTWYEQASEGGGGSSNLLIARYIVAEDMESAELQNCSLADILDVVDAGGYVVAVMEDSAGSRIYLNLVNASPENGAEFNYFSTGQEWWGEKVELSYTAIGTYYEDNEEVSWAESKSYVVDYAEEPTQENEP